MLDTAPTEQEAYSLGFSIGHTPTQDAYTWCVLCTDGTVLREYDRPEGRGFAEVAGLPLAHILLLPLQGNASHSIDIPQGATPVFFRRRSIEINPFAGESKTRPTWHCIGWKNDEEAVYLFVSERGSAFRTNDLQAV